MTEVEIDVSVTDEDVAAFCANGAVCLRRVFRPEWVERMRAAMDERIGRPGTMRRDFSTDKKFFDETFIWVDHPSFRDFVFHSPAGLVARTLLRAASVNLLFDQILVKEPGASDRTPWHNDLPYWPVSGDQVASVWFALDPVTRDNGAVEYVKGSHRWNQGFLPRSFYGDRRYRADLPEIPDIDAMRDRLEFLQWEMEPGDCLVHHGLTVHGAPGNQTATARRRALVSRWCGENVRYDPRPNIQPMLRDPGIPSGAPLDSDLFPRVWPRTA
jgi:ectoine hydroxylase-related dioxygenase (phytanoyl-CoA dioxygenase family)